MNKVHIIILVLSFIFCFSDFGVRGLCRSDVNLIRRELKVFFNKHREDPQNHRFLIPGVVRLAFHDCSGINCDGCINKSHPFNLGGVVRSANFMEDFFNEQMFPFGSVCDIMSRADFWALGYIEAVKYGVEINNRRFYRQTGRTNIKMPPINIPFKYGRQDCDEGDGPFYTREVTPNLPPAFMNNKDTLDFMYENFGFNILDTVVMMGGHSLGRSRNTTSLEGIWENKNIDGLSTRYFKNMLKSSLMWAQEGTINPRGVEVFKWVGETKAFGLDTDLNLVKNFDVNQTNGEASCTYEECPNSPTKLLVNLASNPLAFGFLFKTSSYKMLANGANYLSYPENC